MLLTTAQQRKVENNLGLVNKVIHDKLRANYQIGICGYGDFFRLAALVCARQRIRAELSLSMSTD